MDLSMDYAKGAMSQLWKSINETFNGFSNGDIFNGSLWKIQPKSRSTTIAVNPDIYDQLNQELSGMYGVPERKGKNGMIYRCMMSNGHDDDPLQQVAITCYQSTSTLSIQGGAHQKWVEDILPEIENKLSLSAEESLPLPRASSTPLHPLHPSPSQSTTAEESLSLPHASSTPVHHQSTTSHHSVDLPNFELDIQTMVTEYSTQCVQTIPMRYCNTHVQTEPVRDDTPQLKSKLQSCQDKIKELSKQLLDFKDIRTNYAQLATAYTELSLRIVALENENAALKIQHEETFQTPKRIAKQGTVPSPTQPLESPNRFQALTVEDSGVVNNSNDILRTGAKSSPSPAQSPKQHVPKPKSASTLQRQSTKSTPPPPTPPSKSSQSSCPQILIFSNSICKRIDEQRFYRGRTTKLYAKSGGTIADVQRLMMDCPYQDPKHVILQAWTNNVTRESMEACKAKAKALIEATLCKFPSAHIMISGVLPRLIPTTKSITANRLISILNRDLKQHCAENPRVSFVDHVQSLVAENGQIREDLYWDKIHLNNQGLGRLVINLRKSIDNVFPPNDRQQPKR